MEQHTGDDKRQVIGDAWRSLCERVATEAMKGSGACYELYLERFSSAMETELEAMPAAFVADALKILKEYDYRDSSQRLGDQEWNAENGYCQHHLPFECCPVGCGEG